MEGLRLGFKMFDLAVGEGEIIKTSSK